MQKVDISCPQLIPFICFPRIISNVWHNISAEILWHSAISYSILLIHYYDSSVLDYFCLPLSLLLSRPFILIHVSLIVIIHIMRIYYLILCGCSLLSQASMECCDMPLSSWKRYHWKNNEAHKRGYTWKAYSLKLKVKMDFEISISYILSYHPSRNGLISSWETTICTLHRFDKSITTVYIEFSHSAADARLHKFIGWLYAWYDFHALKTSICGSYLFICMFCFWCSLCWYVHRKICMCETGLYCLPVVLLP